MSSRIDKDEMIDNLLKKGFSYDQIAVKCQVGYNSISKRVKFSGGANA